MSFGRDMAGVVAEHIEPPFVVAAVLLIAAGFLLGFKLAQHKYESEALERGLAYYNPTNGVWQWKQIP